LTVVAALTKPDRFAANNQASLTLTLLDSCLSLIAAGQTCGVGSIALDTAANTPVADVALFNSTCCVSGWGLLLPLHGLWCGNRLAQACSAQTAVPVCEWLRLEGIDAALLAL
jgi:hypothetical protein